MNTSNSSIKKQPGGTLVVLLVDILTSMVASIIAVLLVRWQLHPILGFQHYVLVWVLFSVLCSLLSFLVCGTQKVVIRHSTYRSIPRLALATLIKESVLVFCLWIQLFHFENKSTEILLIFIDSIVTLLLLIMMRVIVIAIYDSMKDSVEKNISRLAVMVYGISDKSVAMVTRLEQSSHYQVVGFLTRSKANAGQILQDRKVFYFENEQDIVRLKVNLGIESVLFARDLDSDAEQNGLVPICLHNGIHILMSPKIEEVDYGGMSQQTIQKVVENDFIPDGMSAFERSFKRGVDFVLSGILLIVFSPLFLICWVALKIGGGPGPVLYKQERIGRFGRPFYILKFRTMKMDAEASGPALYAGDDDPRLTKVGRFLRKHHLDELPQLFNVFKGEMAFVGYRPERKFYIDQIMECDPRYYYLYQIRPGVTSYATLKNGYTDSMDKMLRRLEFDLYYLRHRSWWFDIKVLWQTFMNIAFGKIF